MCASAIKIPYPFTQQTLHFCFGSKYEEQKPSHKQILITAEKYFHLGYQVYQRVCWEVWCTGRKREELIQCLAQPTCTS